MQTSVLFGPLEIAHDERVLTPREWTTMQSRWASELMRSLPEGPLLELCCGAGQIGLLALRLQPRRGVLVDGDPVACEYARRNSEAAGLAEQVEIRLADVTEALRPGECFPIVLVDPPYLPTPEVARFPEDPVRAVDGGPDGLDVARTCLRALDPHLHPQGAVLIQVADGAQAVSLSTWLGSVEAPQLEVVETRSHPRGAVARLGRPRH